jgi:hypothetical protein
MVQLQRKSDSTLVNWVLGLNGSRTVGLSETLQRKSDGTLIDLLLILSIFFLDFSSSYHQINVNSCQYDNIITRITESFGGGLVVL